MSDKKKKRPAYDVPDEGYERPEDAFSETVEEATVAPAAAPPSKPSRIRKSARRRVRGSGLISLEAFTASTNRKFDQTAGFGHWANANGKTAPKTAKDWEDTFAQFLASPI